MAEMFRGPFTARACIVHQLISSLATLGFFMTRSAVFSRAAIFKGSSYKPKPTFVSRNDAAKPSYSGFSRINVSRVSKRLIIRSSFLLNSSTLLAELGYAFFLFWLIFD